MFRRLLIGGDGPEDGTSVFGRTILGILSNVHTRSGLSRMDAITALASWPKSIDEIAHAVADPDSPPTAAQIREVARAIGDGDVHIIVNGDRTNLRLTQHVILGCLRLATMVQEEGDRGPVIPKKVMSYGINALLAAVGGLATIVLLIILYR